MEVATAGQLAVQQQPVPPSPTAVPEGAGPQQNPNPVPAADSVTLTPLNRVSALNLLRQQVFASLNHALSSQLRVQPLSYTVEMTPEQLMGQAISSIWSLLGEQSAQPNQPSATEVLAQARAGVDEGFAVTEQLLSEQGSVPTEVEGDFTRSRDLLNGALHDLTGDVSVRSGAEVRTVATSTARFEESRSQTVVIETRDGDIVTLEIGAKVESESSIVRIREDGLSIDAASSKFYQESSLSVRVEGSLDRRELKAIDKLVRRIDKFADKFFDGKIGQALRKFSKFRFNTEELAGFAVSLAKRTTVSLAQTFSVTATPDSGSKAPVLERAAKPVDAAPPAVPLMIDPDDAVDLDALLSPDGEDDEGKSVAKALGDLSGIVKEFAKLFEGLGMRRTFKRPGKVLSDIMAATLDHRHHHRNGPDASDREPLRFAKAMVKELFDR